MWVALTVLLMLKEYHIIPCSDPFVNVFYRTNINFPHTLENDLVGWLDGWDGMGWEGTLPSTHFTGNTTKTPVTHPRMPRRSAARFLIWNIVRDLRILIYICILVRSVPIVLVASATDAVDPQASYERFADLICN